MTGIIQEAEDDVVAGFKKIEDVFESPSAALSATETKLESDGGKIAVSLLTVSANDIFFNGNPLDSASYFKAIDDCWQQIPDDCDLLKNDLFAVLNAFVSQLATANPTLPQAVAMQNAA